MNAHRPHVRNASWIVFVVTLIVYWFSVERVGSLWDVGEFILGAHKLQVVHPPGAPLFLIVGRLFAWVAELFSDDPATIAFAVNFMSAICTSFAAFFIAQITGLLGKLALVGDDRDATPSESIALGMAALCGGLATAFATSIWFSAVEGEVYAMSTLFTCMTFWAMVKWYTLPDTARADRWIVFAVFATGLSVGVHLLSLLTFPALAMFYFYKKYPTSTSLANTIGAVVAAVVALLSGIVALVAIGNVLGSGQSTFTFLFFGAVTVGFLYLAIQGFRSTATLPYARALGGLAAALGGVVVLIFAQAAVIKGIPALWAKLEIFMVNGLGMPFHTGLIPVAIILFGIVGGGLYFARKRNSRALELITMSVLMLVVGFSVVGVVMIRANASTPINMNAPTDAMRLQYYLNREQYGERPLVFGPHFAPGRPIRYDYEDRYGRVGDRYEVVDKKITPVYRDDVKMLFPRMADATQNRPDIYRGYWMGGKQGVPSMGDNLDFFVRYQLDWMYWRYFMWNFSGRQNHEQGFYDNDPRSGNWITGINFIDEMLLGVELDEVPEEALDDEGRNAYYLLPFLFGLAGLFFHLRRRPEDFLAVLALFVVTGIGIILYTNQPPNEPRERDYVQAGAVFTYCIWLGMGVLALFSLLRSRLKLSGIAPAAIAGAVVLIAPALMAFQGFDDHSRMEHEASRDYAANFLNSLEENAIIFTYGDNDTYPLWYAQEVEGVRPDVRVINLSLIAVDWYIDLLRRKINDSEAIKLTLPAEAIRGEKRNQVPINPAQRPVSALQALAYAAKDHPVPLEGGNSLDTDFPSSQVYLPVTPEAAVRNGLVDDLPDSAAIQRVDIDLSKRSYLLKDDLAVLDVVASNAWDRPIYFAVTVPQSKMLGLMDYMRLEGLALRLTPFKSRSEPQYGPMGAGRVDTDRVYDNVVNKFNWGRFDDLDLFVDPSYTPSVQSMQFMLVRTMQAMLRKGDDQRANEIAKLYLERFPHMNFRFNYNTMAPIQVLLQTGSTEEAKVHLRTLAESTGQWLAYYQSQPAAVLAEGTPLDQELRQAEQTVRAIQNTLTQIGDASFSQEIDGLLGASTPSLPRVPAGTADPS